MAYDACTMSGMEYYINELATATLIVRENGVEVPADLTPTVTFTDSETGVDIAPVGNVVIKQGTNSQSQTYDYYEASVAPEDTGECRDILVEWSYVLNGIDYVYPDILSIVNPLFRPEEFWQSYPDFGPGGSQELTYDEVRVLEAKVRRAVEAYVGYEFNYYEDHVFSVLGNGSDALQLTEPIVRLEKVATRDDNVIWFNRYQATDEEVVAGNAQAGDPKIQEVAWDKDQPWLLRRTNDFDHPVYNDSNGYNYIEQFNIRTFQSGVRYFITADTGYRAIPSKVKYAAMMLANEWLCSDFTYHKKNIKSVKSADYSFDYFTPHHNTTGNVEVDRLLNSVRRFGVWLI